MNRNLNKFAKICPIITPDGEILLPDNSGKYFNDDNTYINRSGVYLYLNEIGYSPSDNILYIKHSDKMIPLTSIPKTNGAITIQSSGGKSDIVNLEDKNITITSIILIYKYSDMENAMTSNGVPSFLLYVNSQQKFITNLPVKTVNVNDEICMLTFPTNIIVNNKNVSIYSSLENIKNGEEVNINAIINYIINN